ncbi:MAG: type VI secretion system protein TssL, long form [Chromatiales bacterium]|nr:type VI secretion system protein TssL, long form [Chromatiales bacterium]
MSDECECPPCPEGLPDWLATFADLMSLLMCFFVLLLSFSVIDAQKYKQIAGSMRMAFGVQRDVEVQEPPKGVSIIAQEFSPSMSEPTPLNVVQQQTTEFNDPNLEVPREQLEKALQEEVEKEIEQQAEEIKDALKVEIEEGMITVETRSDRIVVRINEKGSFPSGSANLKPGFLDVMDRIAGVIKTDEGKVVVAGHTDNIPINTSRFRSNWELSAARAVTVAHALVGEGGIDASRLLIEGHAENDPLVPNDSWENRAKNRRVELVLLRPAHVPEEVGGGS